MTNKIKNNKLKALKFALVVSVISSCNDELEDFIRPTSHEHLQSTTADEERRAREMVTPPTSPIYAASTRPTISLTRESKELLEQLNQMMVETNEEKILNEQVKATSEAFEKLRTLLMDDFRELLNIDSQELNDQRDKEDTTASSTLVNTERQQQLDIMDPSAQQAISELQKAIESCKIEKTITQLQNEVDKLREKINKANESLKVAIKIFQKDQITKKDKKIIEQATQDIMAAMAKATEVKNLIISFNSTIDLINLEVKKAYKEVIKTTTAFIKEVGQISPSKKFLEEVLKHIYVNFLPIRVSINTALLFVHDMKKSIATGTILE